MGACITLGAKNLCELIANAPGDDVALKKADNHWAEIKSDGPSRLLAFTNHVVFLE